MIPWSKFQSDEKPCYTDLIYCPTPSILARHVATLPHQSLLLNAPPLENADDRRFAIAQLTPEQREHYLSTFHSMHVSRIQQAIDTLEGYFRRHELVPLSKYDKEGWPGSYGGRATFEAKRKRDERGEALADCSSQSGSRHASFDDNFDSLGDDVSDDSSESEPDYEQIYDFPSSLAGLSLDCVGGLFGDEAVYDPERPLPADFMLSPKAVSRPATPLDSHLENLLQPSQPVLSPPSPNAVPPPLTTSATVTTLSTLLPPISVLSTTSASVLSISNLIHLEPRPIATQEAISITSSTDPGDPDIIPLPATMSSIGLRSNVKSFDTTSQQKHRQEAAGGTPLPVTKDVKEARRVIDLVCQRYRSDVPQRTSRTIRPPRMRKPLRSEANAERDKYTERDRGGSDIDREREMKKLEAESELERERIQQRKRAELERGRQIRPQPFTDQFADFGWSQLMKPEWTASSSPSQHVEWKAREDTSKLDAYMTHQLPTSAIKYEPLDTLGPLDRPHQQTQQTMMGSLKRKEREEDYAESRALPRPPWMTANAERWPPPYRKTWDELGES